MSALCLPPVRSSSHVAPTTAECDDGSDVQDDACPNRCTEPACGDAIVQDREECDDGNDIQDDECTKDACRTDCSAASVVTTLSTAMRGLMTAQTTPIRPQTAPDDGIYAFDLSDSLYDTVLHTYDYGGTCNDALRACDDDSGLGRGSLTVSEVKSGEPILFLDHRRVRHRAGSHVQDIDLLEVGVLP